MPVEIVWSPLARARLQEIRAYVARDKPDAAGRLATRIVTVVEALRNHPHLGRAGAEPGIRELVIGGTITKYREGSRFARAMLIGLRSAKVATDVSSLDGQSGRELTKAKVDLLWAMGGLVGASQAIEHLIEKAGCQIADARREARSSEESRDNLEIVKSAWWSSTAENEA